MNCFYIGMSILPRPTKLAPPCFAPRRFSPSRKGHGVGMGQDFSLAPQDRARIGLKFLNPPRRAPPHPRPAALCLALLRIITVNFSYPKTLLFKQNISILTYFILPNVILYLYFVICYTIRFFCDYLVKR